MSVAQNPIWPALLAIMFLVALLSGSVELGLMVFILIWGGCLYVVVRHVWEAFFNGLR